jgi:hypothetical protein
MQECPFCGSDLQRRPRTLETRQGNPIGGKSTADALITCPDCDEVIDGFSAH